MHTLAMLHEILTEYTQDRGRLIFTQDADGWVIWVGHKRREAHIFAAGKTWGEAIHVAHTRMEREKQLRNDWFDAVLSDA